MKNKFLEAIDEKEIFYIDNGRIHINGYFYEAGESSHTGDGKTWRHVEFSWCHPDMNLLRSHRNEAIDECETECKQYIEELTPEQVLAKFDCYFCGKRPVAGLMNPDAVGKTLIEGVAYIDVSSLPEFPTLKHLDCRNARPSVF